MKDPAEVTATDIKQGLTNIKLIVSVTIVCLISVVFISLFNSYQIRAYYEKSCENVLTLRDVSDQIIQRGKGTSKVNPNYNEDQKIAAAAFFTQAHNDLASVKCR